MSLRRLRIFAIAGTVLVLALLVALSLIARLGLKQSASANVPAPLAIGTELQRPRPVPAVSLVDEQGKPFSLSQWRGRWVILAPSMTLCHEVCPMTTAVLTQMADEVRAAGLSRQVVVAEATVDPWRDTPSRLRAYRKLTGLKFAMLTGSQAQIARLWKFFGVYYHRVPQDKPPDIDWLTHKPETFDVDHTDAVFFLDPAGQERIANEGMPEVSGRLTPVLHALLNDAGRHNLAHPQLPWTAAEALDDLYFLMNRNVPADAVPKVTAPDAAQAARALAGSPSTLAALHAQAGRLIGGDVAGCRPRPRAPRLSGGGERLGLVVRPMPDRVPVVRDGLGEVRAPGGVPRGGHERLLGRRTFVPGQAPGELPELSGLRPVVARGARERAHDGVRKPRRQGGGRPHRAVRHGGSARERHPALRAGGLTRGPSGGGRGDFLSLCGDTFSARPL